MQQLHSKLVEQQWLIDQQREALELREQELFRAKSDNYYPEFLIYTSPSIEVAADPSPGSFSTVQNSVSVDNSNIYGFRPAAHFPEVNHLQSGLGVAQSNILAMNDGRVHTRIAKHTLDQVLRPPGEDGPPPSGDALEQALALHNAFGESTRAMAHRSDSWPSASYNHSITDHSTEYHRQPLSTGTYFRPGVWAPSMAGMLWLASLKISASSEIQYQNTPRQNSADGDAYGGGQTWSDAPRSFNLQGRGPPATRDGRYMGNGLSYNSEATPFVRSKFEHARWNKVSSSRGHTPSSIGTPPSPYLPVGFPSGTTGGITLCGQTKASISGSDSFGGCLKLSETPKIYLSTIEQLHYLRLLERNVNSKWKYIVDRIVINDDKQAFFSLQRKLMIGSAEQKHVIVNSIVAQAYPLMVNRFGNFLVQRCFENGTPEQIDGIASVIRGNTRDLSMDAFGCHVIQKAFDCVSEASKATMVAELLQRIPETVIDRCE